MSENTSEALGNVISKWLGLEKTSFPSAVALDNLWRHKHGTYPPYDPDGIESLISRVKKASLFKDCEDTRDLDRGQFIQGGGVRSFGDLYDYLKPCEPGA